LRRHLFFAEANTMTHKVTLGRLAVGRDNNFNLIRMLAATAVLVSHAYPITLGPKASQPLETLTHGLTLGALAVAVFFGLSGYLITASFVASQSARRFWAARLLRLFPGLICALLLTVLVAGLWLTISPHYWSAVPGYLLQNLTLFRLRYDLPGVFEANPYGDAINGSLWTLGYEFLCYAAVFVLGQLGAFRPGWTRWASCAALLCFFGAAALLKLPARLELLADLGLPFFAGSLLYVLRHRVRLSWPLALAAIVATVALSAQPFFRALIPLALVYLAFCAAHLPTGRIRLYNRLGDYSYGMYIYAFPVQQLVTHYGALSPVTNMAAAFPLTLILAILSWHLVEKPALSLVRRRSPTAEEKPSRLPQS
jgi:peptidoglycan/LPS O-acetylase OafA/YrhL